ncbi:immunity 53 family protein [Paenibacillus sp. KQZ6P-2]|uniref:Immunity 53 family protein n=1 Tax=Paenibacillus mangrovi TaxID=2931978 RepID=A0A9X1WLQ9_9BACL|nr:Imm53 family immunity protein [Paenibacillus mangrovi]MCJ8010986.1 immunity 53 family protein [Paenibacillus mangrovi]
MVSQFHLRWLQDWYFQNCNGDWEHSFGVTGMEYFMVQVEQGI